MRKTLVVWAMVSVVWRRSRRSAMAFSAVEEKGWRDVAERRSGEVKGWMAESSVCGGSVWDCMVEEEPSRSDGCHSHMVLPKTATGWPPTGSPDMLSDTLSASIHPFICLREALVESGTRCDCSSDRPILDSDGPYPSRSSSCRADDPCSRLFLERPCGAHETRPTSGPRRTVRVMSSCCHRGLVCASETGC